MIKLKTAALRSLAAQPQLDDYAKLVENFPWRGARPTSRITEVSAGGCPAPPIARRRLLSASGAEWRGLNTHVRGSSMRASSEARRAIVGVVIGLLYGSLLALVSLFAAGAGHGTGIPLLLSSAPFDVFSLAEWDVGAPYVRGHAMFLAPPIVWATLGSLAALSGRGRSLRLAQALTLLHYASGLALVATRGADLLPLPSFVNVYLMVYILVWATVYLIGQAVMWWRLVRRSKPTPTSNDGARA
jgi:hypothetical protein